MAEIDNQPTAHVIACVNHDPKAIQSHWLNHPDVEHFNEDITRLYGQVFHGMLFKSHEFLRLQRLVDLYRAFYPMAKVILWASLECTNFSKAKGGMARDADSRTLAHHLDRYIGVLQPDFIKIENVVEFMSWGPLTCKVVEGSDGYSYCPFSYVADSKGTLRTAWKGIPESNKNGQDWLKWRQHICSLGYRDEWRQLNSADFGAYTSRNRLFGIFAKPDLPIVWPTPTYSKDPAKMRSHHTAPELFPGDNPLLKWKPVRDVLDFADEGQSILNRNKPLCDKTLERIYAGLVKFIAKGDVAFLTKYFSGTHSDKNISVERPAGTLTTVDHHALVQTDFLTHYYSGGGHISPVDAPCPTITAMDGKALIQSLHFLEKQYSKGQNQSVDEPAGTLMPTDKHRVVTAEPFLMPTNYDNQPQPLDQPSPSIIASRRHHYLVNPSWGGNPVSVEGPCCVIVARQDKVPLYFIQVEQGPVSIAIYETDTPVMIRIKQFMAAFGLVDIKMRMLRVPELLRIQGFPDTYRVAGNQGDQKKFIGNSVVPSVVKAWAEAMGQAFLNLRRRAA